MTTTTSNNMYHHYNREEPMNTIHHRRVSLIKRPPLVRSSSSSTSVQNNGLHRTSSNASLNNKHRPKKSVRFCDNASLENVRLFLKSQMPKACQSDPACAKQYTYRLRRSNWPSETAHTRRSRIGSAVRVEDVQLLSSSPMDKFVTLIGTCQVANLAFEKHVVIRYSFDEWTTVNEVEGIYQEPIANSANTWDRFSFKIVLNVMHHAHETLYLAVKYTVSGREFWDNNDGKNYQVDIIPDVQLQLQHDDLSSSSDEEDDDDNTFEDCIDEEEEEDDTSTSLIKQLEPLSLNNKPSSFGNRYDFNSSANKPWSPPLSPTTPADTNPLWTTTTKETPTSPPTDNKTTTYFNNNDSTASSPVSTEYGKFHDIIHKYCFYSDHRRPAIYTQYHSDPPRCSSPTPKAIHS